MNGNLKTGPNFACAFCCSMFVVFWAVAAAHAQSGGGYVIKKGTIDSGGGTVSGGAYLASGTVGQHDASDLAGGSYVLSGGFWNVRQPSEAIPAVSEWGLVVLALVLAVAASMILTSRHGESQMCGADSG